MMTEAIANTCSPLEKRTQQLAHYFLLLRRLQDRTDADFIASLGNLNMQQLNVLNVIGDSATCTMGEIATRVSLSLSSVTVIVNKLVKLGLVKRLRDRKDRRIVFGSLTTEGKDIYAVQIKHMNEMIHKMLTALSDNEQAGLLHAFHKITEARI